jgi:GNAT superfamily N-acetyltransferase
LGFCRAVTDFATFGWICDVFVDEGARGGGLGVWMVETLLNLPELEGITLVLATADAQELYRRFGFSEVAAGRWLSRRGNIAPPGLGDQPHNDHF